MYADEDVEITWGFRAKIKTGIAAEIPAGCYGRLADRSGLANNNGLTILGGVVDASYRGEIQIILQNHGGGPFQVKRGMRIAQLILERAETPDIEEVDELTKTSRGEGGFGSTGV
jgi:dUTP pyrophosphatase